MLLTCSKPSAGGAINFKLFHHIPSTRELPCYTLVYDADCNRHNKATKQ